MTNTEIKVLMVDDDEEDYIITRDIISEIDHRKYSIQWIGDYDSGLNEVMKQNHHVYLIDYNIGAKNGVDLIREAKAKDMFAPFILLTGQNDIHIDNSALEVGASDFLVKGKIDSHSLETSIRYSIEHARIQKQQNQLNQYLEDRIRERTAVLEDAVTELNKTKKELSDALRKEKELNELKSRFVATTSHEFRTPLAMVLSSLSLVQKYGEQNDKDNQLRHILRIKSAVNHLTDLLNDVLSVSKQDEGKQPVKYEEFDLTLLLSEVQSSFQSLLKNDQTLNVLYEGNKTIISDLKMLHQILTNLVSNAIKFSPKGGSVLLSARVNKDTLEITVSDQGIGIPKEDQEHLFGRFFRGRNATAIQGTGLGLNIVAKNIEMLNGQITCESDTGKGTTFVVRLPQGNI